MKRFIFIIIVLISHTTVWAGDHEEARRLQSEGEILPLENLVRRAQAEVSGRVIEVELERDDSRLVYEIELLDNNGQVWEFNYDAVSGELLEMEKED